MNRVLSWAEFLTDIKTELEIQEINVNEDAFLLSLANEALTQVVSTGKFLRDFRVDITEVIIDPFALVTTNLVLAEIDQVYYRHMQGATLIRRYDLIEQSGVVGPPPPMPIPVITPSSYTIKTDTSGLPISISTTLIFYPPNSGIVNDEVQFIGSGFRLIVDASTLMPYFSAYAAIKAFIYERYAIKRNLDVNKVALISKLVDRYSAVTAAATADDANTENTKK